MLPNHIGYGIYLGESGTPRVIRRQSWPRGSAPQPARTTKGLRAVVGHALIGLGQLVAAERQPSVATRSAAR
jgi:hypothetical protein